MTELFTDTVLNMMTTTAEPEDYTGEDGLLYCGKCRTAKEAYFPKETAAWLGHDKHPTECDCQREKRLECESAEERRRHLDTVMELKRRGFTDLTMQEWTFAHDNGKCPQMSKAHLYVEHWEQMRENNYGLLLWGKVGTGKSYFAVCIANALMEQEISVRMTNFSAILNDLTASFEGRNEYIERLCRFPLLILDDFGMERGTEYGLEQVYNVIDSRYRSRKPLIVTTNLSLTELQNPQDTAHARIYDRVLEMCLPILFTGENFRKETAQAMLTDYENEQNELNKIIETDTADMQRIIGGQNNVERFIKLVKKYENITELTPAMINEFIDKILVHEPQGKGADRTTEVEIYLNYVGQFQVPVEQYEPTEEERIAAEKEADRLRRKRESNRKYMKKIREKSKEFAEHERIAEEKSSDSNVCVEQNATSKSNRQKVKGEKIA